MKAANVYSRACASNNRMKHHPSSSLDLVGGTSFLHRFDFISANSLPAAVKEIGPSVVPAFVYDKDMRIIGNGNAFFLSKMAIQPS